MDWNWKKVSPTFSSLKGHSQLWDHVNLDTTFASLKSIYLNHLPQPEIKSTHWIHVEIHFNPT